MNHFTDTLKIDFKADFPIPKSNNSETMKNKLLPLIFFLCFLICFDCQAQDTLMLMQPKTINPNPRLNEPESFNNIGASTIKKGSIILNNGETFSFSNLTSKNDSVFFTKSNSSQLKFSLSEVNGISKTKTIPGISAAVGGCLGLLSGLLVAAIANPQRTPGEWLIDQIDPEGEEREITSEDLPYIAIGTAAGAAIGAVVGLTIHRGKLIYKSDVEIKVSPVFSMDLNKKDGLLFTLKFNFNQ